jgi:hypothetical protein
MISIRHRPELVCRLLMYSIVYYQLIVGLYSPMCPAFSMDSSFYKAINYVTTRFWNKKIGV